MLENAYYSVIAPESCAAIIWRDSKKAPLAAAALHLTAADLLALKIIDGIVPEPPGGAHLNPEAAIASAGVTIRKGIEDLSAASGQQLLDERYLKFREMGSFFKEA
jgi:acetyl-CoA carboxylase carboxyl transferase subunit alpha